MNSWDDFTGLNEGYALELYENYRRIRVGGCGDSRLL
jgi:hypothetical protein